MSALETEIFGVYASVFPSYAWTGAENALDLLHREITDQRTDKFRLSARLNTAIGAFAGLAVIIGLKWDTEIAKLCNIASTEEDWKAAIEKAHKLFPRIRLPRLL